MKNCTVAKSGDDQLVLHNVVAVALEVILAASVYLKGLKGWYFPGVFQRMILSFIVSKD